MNNFPVIFKGKQYWVSRSIAVVVKFACNDGRDTYVLAVQRGKGTPDPKFVGSWCMPCGYLDYNETTKEAASRELFEETGLKFDPKEFVLVGVNDIPESDARQNVTFRFVLNSYFSKDCLEKLLTNKYSEPDEVSDIKFINIKELDKYTWAFNHRELIEEL